MSEPSPAPVIEPDQREAGPRTARGRLLAFAAAGIVAALGAWVAPDDWTAGPVTVEVGYLGATVISDDVELGDATSYESTGRLDGVDVTVGAPGGFALGGPIELTVTVDDPARDPVLGDVDVVLIDEGVEELVPVLSAEGGVFEAARRPPDGAGVVLAILGAAIVLWITEALPLFVTSLGIPVAISVAELGSADEALAPFFDPIIVLFFGGFILARAMRRVRLDHLVAVSIVDVAGHGPIRLYGAMIALSAFMSMWMSNTAAVTVLIPIVLAVTEPIGSTSYRKALTLAIAYAATIGGVGSAIGTPANPLAIDFIGRLTGREITFAGWFAFGLPMLIVFLPVMAVYLWWVSRVDADLERFREAAAVASDQRRAAGRLTPHQLQVLVVFLGIVSLWLTQSWHGVNTGIVALGGAVVLFAIGRVEPDDLGRISWPTLLTFGGGLTLGTFMVTTGTSDWIVTRLDGLAEWPELLAIFAVAFVALGLTTVASNTAAAATLIPLAIPLAGIIGVDPVLLVVIVAIASSIDFALVIGTPPTMLAYSTGQFSAREILAKGSVLDVVGVLLLVLVVVPIWYLLGIV